MERKKILIIITKSNWGGAQRYVYDIAVNLPKDNFDIVVAHGGKDILHEKLRNNSIRAISLKSLNRDISLKDDLFTFKEVFELIRAEKPDILHLNSSKMGAIGAFIGRLLFVPKIVFTIHGFAFNENRSTLSKKVLKMIYFFTILLSHKSIAVSEMILKQCKDWPLISKKMIIIKNGINKIETINKDVSRDDLKKKLPALANKNLEKNLWVASVGELHHIKGHIYAIRAIADITDISYVIFGNGELKFELKKEIDLLGLSNRVILAGYAKDIAKILPAFDIFLFPSLSEGLPYALLEAGMIGIPCLASNVGGIPEIIKNGENGLLFTPKDSDSIKEALLKFKNLNNEQKEEFSRKIKEKISLDFSLEKMIKETQNIFLS